MSKAYAARNAAICDAYRRGEKLEAIAAEHDMCKQQVYQIARRHGLPLRAPKLGHRTITKGRRMNLLTILRAIQIVGDLTPAAMALYEGFIADTTGVDREELTRRYALIRERSDELHRQVQAAFSG